MAEPPPNGGEGQGPRPTPAAPAANGPAAAAGHAAEAAPYGAAGNDAAATPTGAVDGAPNQNDAESAPVDAPSAHALLEFAKVGAEPLAEPLAEDLEGIIKAVARTGSTEAYPWDALRMLLARKVELVLAELWREAPDVRLPEGEAFERAAVEPLTRSLLEPRREGPPFTVQRLCELLTVCRATYRSTRKYLYALQRAVLVTSTEQATSPSPEAAAAASAA
eukprot:CAMPEP_0176268062 /NCGR_PEP_ID=MMETSP0121_2-20121125/43481_1 /TAXON_ID=160619 /ORGANISM="Kryptoperidinium foliaceum, Strain CCMP 1326" /LENGTH=220 /DNA_ID=CAMNT_0017608145 /DNA_START=20 /DNA_END=679 /DNA_ORIENTATION=+